MAGVNLASLTSGEQALVVDFSGVEVELAYDPRKITSGHIKALTTIKEGGELGDALDTFAGAIADLVLRWPLEHSVESAAACGKAEGAPIDLQKEEIAASVPIPVLKRLFLEILGDTPVNPLAKSTRR